MQGLREQLAGELINHGLGQRADARNVERRDVLVVDLKDRCDDRFGVLGSELDQLRGLRGQAADQLERLDSCRINGADEPRNTAIRRVLLALSRNAEPEDMVARDRLDIVPLWNEARFVLVRTLEGPLLGEKYQLTNLSNSRMIIDERELYRRGVLAVMVESPELEPGEATQVFVVLEGRDG